MVQEIITDFIQPAIKSICPYLTHTGSSYELTSVPGKSDFDLQFCLKMPRTKQDRVKKAGAIAERSSVPGWRRVKGGPEDLLNDAGYMCALKVYLLPICYPHYTAPSLLCLHHALSQARTKVLAVLDKAIKALEGNSGLGKVYEIKRSTSGPAVTLKVKKRDEPDMQCEIDVVICIKAIDMQDR